MIFFLIKLDNKFLNTNRNLVIGSIKQRLFTRKVIIN